MKKKGSLLLLGAMLLLIGGCVENRMYIQSEPAGAKVYVNREYKGETPVDFEFDWYWYHQFLLMKDGYVPLEEEVKVKAPVSQWIPFDLFMEIIPYPFVNKKELNFTLQPDNSEDIF